ncbi:MAG: cyclic nucleotide-binding domain-containing protein [Actinobacteria bacterium]|jgi:CRP/FNR family cyclic AMP-dependent transcriptional regulator|nr:cyclic nucleotide-binding domain-containing protein [Actinomycetota bacterium]
MGSDSKRLAAVLTDVDLFRGLSSRVISRIAESGHEQQYAEGAQVVAQGDSVTGFKAFSPAGVEMHIVLDGTARVLKDGVEVNRLSEGEYFGELSLIDGQPRSADVVAAEGGLTTLALSRWTFEDLLDKHPEVAVPMLRVLCSRLRAVEAAHR